MKRNTSIHNSMTGKYFNKILLFLALVTITNASCDGVDFFNFAEDMSKYGPKWSYDDVVAAVTVTFPEDVVNADLPANYSVHYSGSTGSVTISTPTYASLTRTATIPITYSGTDGSKFRIEIISSATPITMGTRVLGGINSPSYKTPGGVVSVINWNSSSGLTLNSTVYIEITFSENVSNADDLANYQAAYTGGGGGSVSINSVTYDSGSRVASLYVISTNTDGSTVSFQIIAGPTPITYGTYTLAGVSSPNYTTLDTVMPYVTGWNPVTGGTIPLGDSTVQVFFSENVVNAGNPSNYNISPEVTGTVNSASYNPATFTTTLDISVSGSPLTTFYIFVTTSAITDSSSNMLMTTTGTFTTP